MFWKYTNDFSVCLSETFWCPGPSSAFPACPDSDILCSSAITSFCCIFELKQPSPPPVSSFSSQHSSLHQRCVMFPLLHLTHGGSCQSPGLGTPWQGLQRSVTSGLEWLYASREFPLRAAIIAADCHAKWICSAPTLTFWQTAVILPVCLSLWDDIFWFPFMVGIKVFLRGWKKSKVSYLCVSMNVWIKTRGTWTKFLPLLNIFICVFQWLEPGQGEWWAGSLEKVSVPESLNTAVRTSTWPLQALITSSPPQLFSVQLNEKSGHDLGLFHPCMFSSIV